MCETIRFFVVLLFLTWATCSIPRPDFEELPFANDAQDLHEPIDTVAGGKELPMDAEIKESEISDAQSDSKPDAFNEVDPLCKPNCYGKVCGQDGCGGICGICPKGTNCSFDGTKCISEKVQLQTGAKCGITALCTPEISALFKPAVKIKNPDWPGCAHDQCLNGKCLVPYCSRDCKIVKDEVVNHAKVLGSDGIEDHDTPSSDCWDVSPNSIVGKNFSCVQTSVEGSGAGNCLPGKEFKPCVSSGDCPQGESCQLISIKGEFEWRCMTKIEGSVEVSERCNYDPYNGEIKYCSSNICHPDWGCMEPCSDSEDCGSWVCKNSQLPLNYSNPFSFNLCVPEICSKDADCPEQFFCQKALNKSPVLSEFGWENRCIRKIKGGAGNGEECNEDKTDLLPDIVCENEGWCINGYCSSLCESDNDCAVEAGQRCVVEESVHDINGDSILDTVIYHGFCLTLKGTNLECKSEANCLSTGETCWWWEDEEAGKFFLATACIAKDPTKGSYGELCGGKSGLECNNGLCLYEDKKNMIEGFCSGLCSSKNDCGKMIIGTWIFEAYCSSVFYSWGGNIDEIDDIYLPLCFPDMHSSTLDDCSSDFKCAAKDEICTPHLIAMNPDQPASVEFLCRKNLNADGKPPVLKFIDPCDPSKGDIGQCSGGLCIRDSFGESYCSMLCNSETDCAGIAADTTCGEVQILDRSDDKLDLTLNYCVKKTGF